MNSASNPRQTLRRLSDFLDGEQGMTADQWFSFFMRDEPGREAFEAWSRKSPEVMAKLWIGMGDDIRAFWARQEALEAA